jgi:hypothetical protein
VDPACGSFVAVAGIDIVFAGDGAVSPAARLQAAMKFAATAAPKCSVSQRMNARREGFKRLFLITSIKWEAAAEIIVNFGQIPWEEARFANYRLN